jgi:NADH dehydrogenase
MKKPKVVIIGAGFAGISLAQNLKKSNFDITILDENNHHTFQPLLYQVATGGLEPDSIAYPIRRIFRGQGNIRFRMAKVERIETDKNVVQTNIGEIEYDHLVIATGSTTNFFKFEGIKEKLFALKSITDALDLRSFLMQNLEKALTVMQKDQSKVINVAIVGGGPAGLEMAGALSEMKTHVLPKDYPELDFDKMHVYLFEAASLLLPTMSQEASEASLKYLNELGVTVHLNAQVVEVYDQSLEVKDLGTFDAETVVWTAGVKGNVMAGINEEQLLPGNRIAVDEFNKVRHLENVYAIGDVAAHSKEGNKRGLPMLAPVGMQQGEQLAKNLVRLDQAREMKPFVFKDKGSMATIGRDRAVVDLPNAKFQGRFAWFVWMFVHLISLVGFRNKLVTLVGWTHNYFNYDRPLGLIIRKYNRKL